MGALDGKTFTIVGRMQNHKNTAALGAELEEAGAHVTYALGAGTDYLVAGDQCGYQVERAGVTGTPVITEAQATRLAAGKLDLDGLDDELAEAKASGPSVDANEVIEALRPLLNAEEPPRWSSIYKAFEGADEEAERVAVDYASHRVAELPIDFTGYNYFSQSAGPRDHHLPKPWKPDVLAGVDSPKLSLVRMVSFYSDRLSNGQLCKMFECPSLDGVQFLDIEGNKPGSSFFKKLAKGDQFANLWHLCVKGQHFKKGHAKALIAMLEGMPNLRVFDQRGGILEPDLFDDVLSAFAAANLRTLTLGSGRALEERHLRTLLGEQMRASLRYLGLYGYRLDPEQLFAIIEEAGELGEGEEPLYLFMQSIRDSTGTYRDYSDELEEAAKARFDAPMRIAMRFGSDDDSYDLRKRFLYQT
jgi:hypothetical protein